MSEWWRDARRNPIFRLTLLIAVVTILLDQATKLWILHGLRLKERPFGHLDLSPIFDLTYVENRGVSFGLLAGGLTSRIGLTVLALVVAGFVLHWAGRLGRRVAAVGAGLIVGGAIGNAIDRSFYGYVVDFIDFASIGFPWRFNIADSAINIGVAFLAVDAFILAPRAEAKAKTGGQSPETTTNAAAKGESDETEGSTAFPQEARKSITPQREHPRSAE